MKISHRMSHVWDEQLWCRLCVGFCCILYVIYCKIYLMILKESCDVKKGKFLSVLMKFCKFLKKYFFFDFLIFFFFFEKNKKFKKYFLRKIIHKFQDFQVIFFLHVYKHIFEIWYENLNFEFFSVKIMHLKIKFLTFFCTNFQLKN